MTNDTHPFARLAAGAGVDISGIDALIDANALTLGVLAAHLAHDAVLTQDDPAPALAAVGRTKLLAALDGAGYGSLTLSDLGVLAGLGAVRIEFSLETDAPALEAHLQLQEAGLA